MLHVISVLLFIVPACLKQKVFPSPRKKTQPGWYCIFFCDSRNNVLVKRPPKYCLEFCISSIGAKNPAAKVGSLFSPRKRWDCDPFVGKGVEHQGVVLKWVKTGTEGSPSSSPTNAVSPASTKVSLQLDWSWPGQIYWDCWFVKSLFLFHPETSFLVMQLQKDKSPESRSIQQASVDTPAASLALEARGANPFQPSFGRHSYSWVSDCG